MPMTTNQPDPFAEGYDAHLVGRSETSNPYEIGSDAGMSWADGFAKAADENGDDE